MKPPKTKRKRKTPEEPRTTAVPDRSPAMPLGKEARPVARYLRGVGADGGLVPRAGVDPHRAFID
jgi:hypothetical protein